MKPDRVAHYAHSFADACHEAELPDTPSECDDLIDALGTVVAETTTLLARIRVVMTGGFECGTPPDLSGKCICCGTRIAPPVASHKSGCNPVGLVIGAAVSASRWAAATVLYLRTGRP